MFSSVHFSSKSVEHATPQALFDLLDQEFFFLLDACANASNRKTPLYFDQQEDALKINWAQYCKDQKHRPVIYCNPPYRKPENPCKPNCSKKNCRARGHHLSKYLPGTGDFVKHGYEAALAGATCVFLLPARTDTAWFHDFILRPQHENHCAVEIRLVRGRLAFGESKNSAPFPSCVVIWRAWL